MRKLFAACVLVCAFALCTVATVQAQELSRMGLDVIWARATTDSITLDGVLDEAAWAQAESIRVQYPTASEIIPGSGWQNEGGVLASDPTDVTFKFLVKDNWLYLAATVNDSSVGGGLFNQFDGFLMNVRRHEVTDRPAPPFEYFYAWVTEPWADPNTGLVGADPGFFGFAGGHRDSINADTGLPNREIWNAATTVNGLANSDTTIDEGYVSEIGFNLTQRGYDVTRAEGDIIEFNISTYDADWQWPNDEMRFSSNRTWLQGPWGNASVFNVMRIHARPDVTVNSGPVPEVGPEIIIPNGGTNPPPVIDGVLDEAVWEDAPGIDLRFDDDALRDSYPSIGPYRSGQFQPEINGVRATVLDPADATLKWFFIEDSLYLGVDVRDQAVWGNANFDQWDGIRIFINDRVELTGDNTLLPRTLTARVDTGGTFFADAFLATLLADTVNGAKAALTLKPGTTADNFDDADTGYSIEMCVDLTNFGYPPGRGDGVLFIGATLHDGDEFANPADNYGNRVWWMHEHEFDAGPAWAFMDPAAIVSVEDNDASTLPEAFTLLGNYPNPFNPSTTIAYLMPEAGSVTLKVYDLLGRSVRTMALGFRSAGYQKVEFNAEKLATGVYFYRLEMVSKSSRKTLSTLYDKMLLLK